MPHLHRLIRTRLLQDKCRTLLINTVVQEKIQNTKMKTLLILVSLMTFNNAFAGPFADALGKKLVTSTTPEEKAIFVRWTYAAMSLHPSVKDLSSITPEKRAEISKSLGQLFNKLITVTCVSEAKEAYKYEGRSSFENAFRIFGQSAMGDFMSNEDVSKYMSEMDKHLDEELLKKTFGE